MREDVPWEVGGWGWVWGMWAVWGRAGEVWFRSVGPWTGGWQSYMIVDSAGVWRLGIARRQSKTEAEILAL